MPRLRRLFKRKDDNMPAYWQAYADAIRTEVIRLTHEQKRQALLEHILYNKWDQK